MARRRPQYLQRKRDRLAQAVKLIRSALRKNDCEGAFWRLRNAEIELLFNHARGSGVNRPGLHAMLKKRVAACKALWRPWGSR